MTLKGVLSLDDAKKRAKSILAEAANGNDPLTERRKAEGAADTTVEAICESYFVRECGMKVSPGGNAAFSGTLRSAAERRATLISHVYPRIGSRQVGEIKRSEIASMLDKIDDTVGKSAADQVYAYMRKILNWHEVRTDGFRSPIVRGMRKGTSTKRDRILSEDELRAFWRALDAWVTAKMSAPISIASEHSAA